MPEGPEIRRVADRLRQAIGARRLARVFFGLPALKRWEERLTGLQIASIQPHGKALLTHFAAGPVLYTHNQLYGRWTVSRDGRLPQTRRQLRVGLFSEAGPALLLYSASSIAVLERSELASYPPLARLGPDPLDPALGPAAVHARLVEPRFRGRRLAALLLDQAFLAGMGNYLRSEVLHVAGIAPQRRASELCPTRRQRLADALLSVPRQSYRLAGITNEPQRAARLEAEGLRFEARRFHVFDRDGSHCYRCGEIVQRIQAAGRRLYYCPACQH